LFYGNVCIWDCDDDDGGGGGGGGDGDMILSILACILLVQW
jgi:hypothetical protein